jgi:large subunit ribosomal protein L19
MISEEILNQIKPGVQVAVRDKFGVFRGVVIARKHGKEPGATFTVRSTVAGVGVEKIFPLYSPNIVHVDILGKPKRVRRAKLYFLRSLSKKNLKRKLGLGE